MQDREIGDWEIERSPPSRVIAVIAEIGKRQQALAWQAPVNFA
jgi:hypothetical protein